MTITVTFRTDTEAFGIDDDGRTYQAVREWCGVDELTCTVIEDPDGTVVRRYLFPNGDVQSEGTYSHDPWVEARTALLMDEGQDEPSARATAEQDWEDLVLDQGPLSKVFETRTTRSDGEQTITETVEFRPEFYRWEAI